MSNINCDNRSKKIYTEGKRSSYLNKKGNKFISNYRLMPTSFSVLKTYKKTADLVPEFKKMYPDMSKSDGPTKAKRTRRNKDE